MSTTSGSTKRSAASLEAMAKFEDAHVTFVDSSGQERHDVTLLDPGASAFLCGYGPLSRYLHYLKLHGYPVEKIEFNRCCRRFQFGGDGSSWSHWVVRLPICISGVLGRAQVFLVKGETPLLCGRPIIEALGIDLAFSRQAIRYRDGPWMPATLGLHGEYLLPLWEPLEDLDLSNLDFQFDFIVAADGEVDPNPCSMQQFEQEEQALVTVVIDLYLRSSFRPSIHSPRRCTMTFTPTSPVNFMFGLFGKSTVEMRGPQAWLKPWVPELRLSAMKQGGTST